MRRSERKVWFLRRLNLFAGMSREEIDEIAGRLRERVCRRRETTIDPHGSPDRIFLIKSGTVRVFHLSPEGRELTTAILRPGQLLGTSALIGVGEQNQFAEATEDSYICEATADEFMRIMSGHPTLSAKVIVTIARQAFHLEQKLERLAFEDVPVRLAQALLQLSEENGGQMPSHITHEELAKLISATRETVSKTLGQFADQGVVELGYRRIIILDEQQLRQLADH